MKCPITEIRVSRRHRRDLGDLSDLAASMDRLGLLHPVVVTEDKRLIAGERRLKAAKQLQWRDIPITIARDLDEAVLLLTAERDENTCRRDLLPSEAVALARDLEPLERKAAKQKQIEAGQKFGRGKPGGISPKLSRDPRAKDKIAEAVGVDRMSAKRATTS